MSGPPVRLVPMVLGFEPIPESISLAGGDPARFLLEPVTAAAVEFRDGWVLLDTGFDATIVRDPARRAAQYDYACYTAIVPPGDPLPDQLAAAGLSFADLRGCALSHLHLDHTGGLRFLVDGPPVLVQRAEWEFATTRAGHRHTYAPGDYLRPGLDVRFVDGDTVLAQGLTALDTRGHTPGHQSFAVELGDRTIVLACDAADLRANLDQRRPCGWTVDPGDALAAQRAVDRLRALDDTPGTEVWPGHDPVFWAGREPVLADTTSPTTP
ncbi:N-acyl homoserine lactonase family protein [Kineococcus sp. SYSU DK003]|uniref:N-acyl homoserine lactonase family protein n=1 Tax=Kineococcus sp. SYSU DK003 TaxID=3383124 RepID=UPI003D7D1CA5